MLLINTTLRYTDHMGIFAKDNIPQGQKIIKFESIIGKWFYHRQAVEEGLLNFLTKFAIYDDEKGAWYLFGDNARFIHHSVHNNMEIRGLYFYATKNIRMGEELTLNYLESCDWVKSHGLKARKQSYLDQVYTAR